MRIQIRNKREDPIFLISRAVKNQLEKLLPYPYVGSAELLEPLEGLNSQLTRGNNDCSCQEFNQSINGDKK
jgi:hypothetical protein